MTIFNRIVMFLLSFLLFAFGSITFLLLTGLVVPGNTYLRYILALYNAWRAIALLRGATTNVAALIALLLAIVGLVLVVLELLPVGRLFQQREAKQYVVRKDAMGEVTLGRSMVRDLVQHVAEAVPEVVHADPEVKDRADGLHLSTRVSLAWDAEAPAVGQLLQERIKESVQTQLGLPVAEVRVTAQAAPVIKEQRRRVA
ncbi:MAG: alkaline shock response membrane anchor protein AmaP [Ktedonobacterales bacterium]